MNKGEITNYLRPFMDEIELVVYDPELDVIIPIADASYYMVDGLGMVKLTLADRTWRTSHEKEKNRSRNKR